MDTSYIKKESVIRKCIDEGKDYYSSYQMQVIKSKFYTAITFPKDSDEYKERIDEVFCYAKDTLSKRIEKVKKKAKAEQRKIAKKNREIKIHNYIIDKENNTTERTIAFKDRTPLPPKYKKNDKDLNKINEIFDVREELLISNDIYDLFGKDYLDMDLYVKTMIEHSILNYMAKDAINEKYPRYIESRHEMFEYITSAIQEPEMSTVRFVSNILNDEVLLRQFMYEVNPYYLDKTSDDYKLIKKEIAKQKREKNPSLIPLSRIQSSISNMKLRYALNEEYKAKTKTL